LQTIEGDVIVTRNPCTHPGDVRILKAIKPNQRKIRKQFDHLCNIIVFSSKGNRPKADMMSGGDLDGDEFFVCWDDKLLSQSIQIVDPAIYDQNTLKVEKPDPKKCKDIADHFVFYLQRDVLGRTANLWLSICDQKG